MEPSRQSINRTRAPSAPSIAVLFNFVVAIEKLAPLGLCSHTLHLHVVVACLVDPDGHAQILTVLDIFGGFIKLILETIELLLELAWLLSLGIDCRSDSK